MSNKQNYASETNKNTGKNSQKNGMKNNHESNKDHKFRRPEFPETATAKSGQP